MTNEEIIQELKENIEELSKKSSYDFTLEDHTLSDGSKITLIKKDDQIIIVPFNDDKPITYKHTEVKFDVGEIRTPNEKEQREWIIDRLRYYYFSNKNEFGKQTYRSLKGMVKKGNIQPALTYLKWRWNGSIMNDFDEMCKSKIILPVTASIKFPNPIQRTIIGIDLGISGGDRS